MNGGLKRAAPPTSADTSIRLLFRPGKMYKIVDVHLHSMNFRDNKECLEWLEDLSNDIRSVLKPDVTKILKGESLMYIEEIKTDDARGHQRIWKFLYGDKPVYLNTYNVYKRMELIQL